MPLATLVEQARLYEIENGEPMTVARASKLLANKLAK
jgi:20S proteasome alpha/beta subunit